MTKNKFKSIVISLFVFGLMVLPVIFTYAAVDVGTGGIDTGGGISSFQLKNPIQATNFEQFLADILNILVQIGVPILVFMTIYTGFLFVKARGNPGELTKAKDTFLNLMIGAFIVLGCFAISEALRNTVAELGDIAVPNIGN
ncbi:MAG: hypothetical protein WCW56_02295 [Candidatus Paceibacterota bacterium]|jgi:hypothetical protein